MVLRVLKISDAADEAILRAQCADVTSFGEELRRLSDDMIETMHASGGCGIAAPQIGLTSNIFIMLNINETGELKVPITMINPSIKLSAGTYEDGDEGCLSIPGMLGKVVRERDLFVVYRDLEGTTHELALSGFPARIFQHEFDHLSGRLFTDIATDIRERKKRV